MTQAGDKNWDAPHDAIKVCLKKMADREQLIFNWKLFDPLAHDLRQAIDPMMAVGVALSPTTEG